MEQLSLIHLAFIVAAYLLGSFSSAITLCAIMGYPDPRSQGSNNPGATNVLRIAGKKAAAVTLLGDLLKGFIPVLAAHFLFENTFATALTGFAAFLGHCFPIYYQFKGGKGVATAFGFVLAFHWLTGLIIVGIWLIVAKVFKLSSLAALIAFICLPFIYYYQQPEFSITSLLALMTLILLYRHKSNISRLLQGKEL